MNKPSLQYWRCHDFLEIGTQWIDAPFGTFPKTLLSFNNASYHLSGFNVSDASRDQLLQLNAVLQVALLIEDASFRRKAIERPWLLEKQVEHFVELTRYPRDVFSRKGQKK